MLERPRAFRWVLVAVIAAVIGYTALSLRTPEMNAFDPAPPTNPAPTYQSAREQPTQIRAPRVPVELEGSLPTSEQTHQHGLQDSGDRGVSALQSMLRRLDNPQEVDKVISASLVPTGEQALFDENYNKKKLNLTPQQRGEFFEWLRSYDAVVAQCAIAHKRQIYVEALRRATTNEVWVDARTETEVAAAIQGRYNSTIMLQTTLEGRECANAYLKAQLRHRGVGVTWFSTGGSRDMTSRLTAFTEGDGSQVYESAKTLADAQAHRRAALRDYLGRR